jgi:uncharacterized membrane protein
MIIPHLLLFCQWLFCDKGCTINYMIRRLISFLRGALQPGWFERHFITLLVVGVVLAMTVSLTIGLHQSVWFDEAYSILVAKQSPGQLLHLTALDTHPPLYYLLLKGWAGLFGWGELALRSLSVLCMGGAAALGILLVRRLFGVRVALMCLPFVVFAPFLLRYGFEIRMYALASFVGIAATYVLVMARQTKERQRQLRLYGLYMVLVALGVYTLYYMVLVWVAHVVWLVWMARGDKQSIVRVPWFVAMCGSVVLFLPWLPVFVSQIGNGALAAISQPLTVDNLTGIVSFMFVYQPTWQLDAGTSLLVVYVIVTLSVFTTVALRSVTKMERSYVVLLAMYVLVPISLLALVSLFRPMYVERYLAHITIAASLFAGVVTALVVRQKKSHRRYVMAAGGLVVVLLVGVAHLAQVGNFNYQRLQTPMVKQAAMLLDDCGKDKTILAADPYVAIELSYYLPSCEVRFYSESATLGGGYAPLSDSPLQVRDPKRELANSHTLVYVHYDQPELIMPETLRETSRQIVGALTLSTFSVE